MNAQQIRKAYLDFFKNRGHAIVPRALLVPQNDPTTLFTGSGMQPILPYLLGQEHPSGNRLTDSQPCVRAQDIEDVGDNRHTTFFEMLGNWSLGDYFKNEQLPWMGEFLLDVVKLDPQKIYVTCFIGAPEFGIPKDEQSVGLWQKLFAERGINAKIADIGNEQAGYQHGIKEGERIFYYDASKNWWCRGGKMADMPVGEPGGPDSEMFYRFDDSPHTPEEVKKYGSRCHPNCDCGRFMEIGNNVFMEYVRTKDGFAKLPKQNVDHGSGLERIAAAALNSPDIFKVSLLWPIVEKLQQLSGKNYESNTNAMRVIADHLRGATFLAVDGVTPSNKGEGYAMRRLMRRAIRFAFDLGVEQNFCEEIIPVIVSLYQNDYPEVAERRQQVVDVLAREEKIFRKTLRQGVREFKKLTADDKLTGEIIFKLYDTYGFPAELSVEEAYEQNIEVPENWQQEFEDQMQTQRNRSRTASAGDFKGGLADHSEITTKYHTATHLLQAALRQVLGNHVTQRGSNINAERIRFDFSHPQKVTPEEIKKVEDLVNQQIAKDLPVTWREENTKQAFASGAIGAFGDKYGEMVKVYTVGDPNGEYFSREICGGPHVEHTGQLAEGNKKFKIKKEEASSAGVRRIKAALVAQ